ncbi:hypothetical protein [Dolichospermum sp. UHCC 0315A]|nr:hypothetical protein [Dolichospermum sp. UHCC 0315A]
MTDLKKWSLVSCQLSVVIGQLSLVSCHWENLFLSVFCFLPLNLRYIS